MHTMLLHFVFQSLCLALLFPLNSSALPRPLNILPGSSGQIYHDTNSDIDPRFTFDAHFGPLSMDKTAFSSNTIAAAVQISQNAFNATVANQRLIIAESPRVVISIVRSSTSIQDLTVRLVVNGLYQTLAAMAARTEYTEAVMLIKDNEELVGYLAWQKSQSGDLFGLGDNSVNVAVAGLPSKIGITVLPFPTYVGIEGDPIQTRPQFLKEDQGALSIDRAFNTLLEAINILMAHPIEPGLPLFFRSTQQQAQIRIDSAPAARGLEWKLISRVLGRVSVFYTQKTAVGYLKTSTNVTLNGMYAATVTLQAWDPSSEIVAPLQIFD